MANFILLTLYLVLRNCRFNEPRHRKERTTNLSVKVPWLKFCVKSFSLNSSPVHSNCGVWGHSRNSLGVAPVIFISSDFSWDEIDKPMPNCFWIQCCPLSRLVTNQVWNTKSTILFNPLMMGRKRWIQSYFHKSECKKLNWNLNSACQFLISSC